MRIDFHLRQKGGEERGLDSIAEFLLKDITNHPGAFGIQHVEGKRRIGRRCRLERQ